MMNRLQAQSFSTVLDLNSAIETASAGKFHPATDDNHALFAPLHYEANYAYPLLIWLHGGGDSEHQLRRVMPHISLRNYVAVAPRGTLEVPRRSGSGVGYRFLQKADHVAQAEEQVLSAAYEAQRR